jgi:hypothetical protein
MSERCICGKLLGTGDIGPYCSECKAKIQMPLCPSSWHVFECQNCAALRKKLDAVIDAFEMVIKFIPVGFPMPLGWQSVVDKAVATLQDTDYGEILDKSSDNRPIGGKDEQPTLE